MAFIPAGEFVMGSDDAPADAGVAEAPGDEAPRHVVYLDAFLIDKVEVTRAEYSNFLQALGGPIRACEGYDCGGQLQVPPSASEYPVEDASWYGAAAYCRWQGKRLPTEAEWEKAARGTDGRRYPWGNERLAEFFPYTDTLYPVGNKPGNASPYGVLDMSGNVWEWTSDWYGPDYYRYSPYRNPTGPLGGERKVLRGTVPALGVTERGAKPPSIVFINVGFRCAHSASR
jgi:formylglycine-generating enzyme required for sulfatase activity